MYLDMTRITRRTDRKLKKNGVCWIGLLFHTEPYVTFSSFPRNSWFQKSSNRGGILFTDTHLQEYQALARKDQTFRVLPDATKYATPRSQGFSQEFVRLAKGRQIIGLVGALDGNKKLIGEFLELSTHPLMEDFYFVLAGEVYETSLAPDLVKKVRKLSGSTQENLFVHDRYVTSEEHFNSFVSDVDILFACYKDFNSSANILAKSAVFHKPVLATRGTRMGDLVDKYNLGGTVSTDTIDDLIYGLLDISKKLDLNSDCFGFAEYDFQVSQENLKNKLGDFLFELGIEEK
jgi:hypothetical protein